ncbi:hypothetical protein ERO13_D08G089001v2 [Gossypium hirsutum]|nr:hypothetical protein ERO13_D08G089001v2 [Gossypium hirsutum]
MRKKQSSKPSSLESNGSSSNQTSPASQWFYSKSSKKELTLDLNQRPIDLLLLCRELMKEVLQGTLWLSRQTCHSVASLLSELHFCRSLSVLKCHIQCYWLGFTRSYVRHGGCQRANCTGVQKFHATISR